LLEYLCNIIEQLEVGRNDTTTAGLGGLGSDTNSGGKAGQRQWWICESGKRQQRYKSSI